MTNTYECYQIDRLPFTFPFRLYLPIFYINLSNFYVFSHLPNKFYFYTHRYS
jgi:hypothetical protein